MIIISAQEKSNQEEEVIERETEFSDAKIEQMRQKVAVAATDAAMEGNYLAIH